MKGVTGGGDPVRRSPARPHSRCGAWLLPSISDPAGLLAVDGSLIVPFWTTDSSLVYHITCPLLLDRIGNVPVPASSECARL